MSVGVHSEKNWHVSSFSIIPILLLFDYFDPLEMIATDSPAFVAGSTNPIAADARLMRTSLNVRKLLSSLDNADGLRPILLSVLAERWRYYATTFLYFPEFNVIALFLHLSQEYEGMVRKLKFLLRKVLAVLEDRDKEIKWLRRQYSHFSWSSHISTPILICTGSSSQVRDGRVIPRASR